MKQAKRLHFAKVLLIGSCMLAMAAGPAMAAPAADSAASGRASAAAAASDELTAKQAEIDGYVFGDGKEALEEQGFSITNTGVMGDKVEVGITPYEDKFADFLYEKFGRDSVRVVEGTQAVLLDAAQAVDSSPAASETKEEDALAQKQREIDEYVAGPGLKELEEQGFSVTNTGVMGDKVEIGITPYDEKHADFLYEKFGRESVSVVEGEQAVLYGAAGTTAAGTAPAADTAAAADAEASAVSAPAGEPAGAVWMTIAAAAIVVAAGMMLAARKKRFARR